MRMSASRLSLLSIFLLPLLFSVESSSPHFAPAPAELSILPLGSHKEVSAQSDELLPANLTGEPLNAAIYAGQAWAFRFQDTAVALNLMARALELDNSADIRDQAKRLLDAMSLEFGSAWKYDANNASIQSLAISPDGSLLIVGNEQGEVHLLRPDGTSITTIAAHTGIIDDLAFSPDGSLLAMGSHDNSFSVWEVEADGLSEIQRMEYGGDWVRRVAFTPDASQLIVTGDMYYTLVYDLASEKVVDTLESHSDYAFALDIRSDSKQFITASVGGEVFVWERAGSSWQHVSTLALEGRVAELRYLEDETRVLAACSSGMISTLDLRDSKAPAYEFLVLDETSGQDLNAALQVSTMYYAGSFDGFLYFGQKDDFQSVYMGGSVNEIRSMDQGQLLVSHDQFLSLGKVVKKEAMTVDQLRNRVNLPQLSLTEQLHYGLYTGKPSLDNLEEATDVIRAVSSLLANPDYLWEYTDTENLLSMFTSLAPVITDRYLQAINQENNPYAEAMSGVVLGLSAPEPLYWAGNLASDTKSGALLQLMGLASNSDLAENSRLYLLRRAYALAPSDQFATMLQNYVSQFSFNIDTPDMELNFPCDANSATFSPRGDYLYVSTDHDEACQGGYLYPMEETFPRPTSMVSFPNQSGIMWQGTFSSDGSRIASASTEGSVSIYTLSGGTEHVFMHPGGEVGFTDARMRKRGDVITIDINGAVMRWEMGSLTPKETLYTHTGEGRKLALANNEETILSVGFDGYLRMYSQGKVSELMVHANGLEDIDISTDGSTAVIGLVGGGLALYRLADGTLTPVQHEGYSDFHAATFSLDGKTIYAGDEDGSLWAYDLNGTMKWHRRIHDGSIFDLDLSPNGMVLVSSGGDDRVTVWQVSSLEGSKPEWPQTSYLQQTLTTEEWSGMLSAMGKAIQNKTQASAMAQQWFDDTPKAGKKQFVEAVKGSLYFDMEGKKKVIANDNFRVYTSFDQPIHGLVWSKEANTMLALGSYGEVYKIEDAGPTTLWSPPSSGDARCMAIWSQGTVAWAGPETLHLVNLGTESSDLVALNMGSVYDLSASPDGKYLAAACAANAVALIDQATGEFQTFLGHDNEVNAVAFLPNGTGMVSGADDGTLRWWNLKGEIQRTLETGANIWSLSISSDGKHIVCGTNEGELILVSATTGTMEKRWSTGESPTWAVAFAGDGQNFASGNNDGEVILWSSDGRETFRFDTGMESIFDVAFSPDGKYLYVGTLAGEVYRLGVEGK